QQEAEARQRADPDASGKRVGDVGRQMPQRQGALTGGAMPAPGESGDGPREGENSNRLAQSPPPTHRQCGDPHQSQTGTKQMRHAQACGLDDIAQGRRLKPRRPSSCHHGRLGQEAAQGRDRKDEARDDGRASGGLRTRFAQAESLEQRQAESQDRRSELKPAQTDDDQIDRHLSGR
ncbi:MAG: hypothetical protein ACK528_02630, partial [Alphaproteobacteria bacterium]